MIRAQLQELYCERRLSMTEVADELKITPAKVLYWLKKFDISRRSWQDSAYVKRNPQGDPFCIIKKLTSAQEKLMIAGLSLYWAEGSKGRSAVRLANLDHRMLALFVRFLREICQIDEQRLYLYVRVYQDFSLKVAQKYWSHYLNISADKVFVYFHSDQRSKKSSQWSEYGIATLEFHNIKLKQWLDIQINVMIDQLLVYSGKIK